MKKKFIDKNINSEESNQDIYNFEKGISSNRVDNSPHSEYSDHIYVKENPNQEQLYDRNNPLVKAILLFFGLIAVIGTLYYVLTGFGII